MGKLKSWWKELKMKSETVKWWPWHLFLLLLIYQLYFTSNGSSSQTKTDSNRIEKRTNIHLYICAFSCAMQLCFDVFQAHIRAQVFDHWNGQCLVHRLSTPSVSASTQRTLHTVMEHIFICRPTFRTDSRNVNVAVTDTLVTASCVHLAAGNQTFSFFCF